MNTTKTLKRVQGDVPLIFGDAKKPAFTLSGLLLTVLVSSIILVALAPVVTRRISETYKPINVKTKGALFTINETDLTKCNIDANITGKDENTCSITLPNGVTNINAVVVGFGGKGTDATNEGEEIHIVEEIKTTQNKTYSPIMQYNDGTGNKNYYVKNLKIAFMTSGGSGGGSGWGSASAGAQPQNQQDCNEAAGQARDVSNSSALTLFMPKNYNDGAKNLCVTKYNVGDNGIPLGVTDASAANGVSIKTSGCTSSDKYCCWTRQNTADTSYCAASGSWSGGSTTYSSCNRTVCMWKAADESCRAWTPTPQTKDKWRLPTKEEMSGWKTQIATEKTTKVGIISNWFGDNGLQLCDGSMQKTHGALSCWRLYSCANSNYGSCNPNEVWSSNLWSADAPNGAVSTFNLLYGSFGGGSENQTCALSARCVLDEIPAPAIAHSGAGGGAGSYLTNQVIKNGFLDEDITVKVTIGEGGSEGENGEDTKVQFGTTTLTAYGAKDNYYGEDGTSTDFGLASIISKRYYKVNSTEYNYNATSAELGQNGEKEDALTTTKTANGGKGGDSAYEFYLNNNDNQTEPTYSGGGIGGNLDDPDGQTPTTPGAGGGGGTATIDESGNITIGKGGKGANGAVLISYDLVPIPQSGSGGAGGGMIIAKNLSINPTFETIQVSFDPTGITTDCEYIPQLNIGSTTTIYALCGSNAQNSTTAGLADTQGAIIEGSTRQGTFETILGMDGELGGEITGTTHLFGGLGGPSGANIIPTCGGMLDTDCQKFNPSTINANGSNGLFSVTPNNIPQGTYGFAGSGGGGGGYDTDPSGNAILGTGGEGAMGYVYIWWTETE